MDAISLIVTALATGASAGAVDALKDGGKDAAKAAYSNLRALAKKRVAGSPDGEYVLERHETDPRKWETVLTGELIEAGASGDAALVAAAKTLMELVDEAGARSGKYTVTFTDSKAVQIGDGNIQFNDSHLWLQERRLDAAVVEARNAVSAADYVASLRAEDAAFVLAQARAGASAGVLRVLVSKPRYKSRVIAIFTHLNRDKARELVAAAGPAAAELELLPDAVEAIGLYQDTGVPELGEATGELTLADDSPQGTRGYYQNFSDGQIHWAARGGAQPTRGANAAYHIGLGGSRGRLGFPLTPDTRAQRPSPFGTDGTWQRFEGSWNYHDETCERLGVQCGATLYWCAPHGTHATWGGIGEFYELQEGCRGWLGFPVSDEEEAGPSHRSRGAGTTGWRQRFEGGVVYYSDKTAAVPVPSPIADYHEGRHGVASSRGFPVSSALTAADSRYGTTGQYQRFEGTEDYPQDILRRWIDGEGPGGATVYTSAHGTYCVGWGNGVLYERLGGTGSWLGFPKSDETDARMSPDEPWCTAQEFEGGTIFFKEKHGSVTVTRPVMDYLTGNGLLQRIGFPVKRENPYADEDDEPVQFFERGVVTIRKDRIDAWLQPDEPASDT